MLLGAGDPGGLLSLWTWIAPEQVPGILDHIADGQLETTEAKRCLRLVSHSDEVKIVTRRFGMGAAEIRSLIELGGYESAEKMFWKKAPEWTISEIERPRACADAAARAFRPGIEMVVCPKTIGQAEVCAGATATKRTRHLQGPPDDCV